MMLKNYFKVAFRRLFKNKVYGFLNITGLALGMASAFVIGTWVYQELSYDRHFDRAEQIYRVGVNFYNIGDMAPGPERFTETVRTFPEVKQATAIDVQPTQLLHVNNRTFREDHLYLADDHFFEVFSYDFLQGNPKTALSQPDEAIIMESTAKKLFGTARAAGMTFRLDEKGTTYQVAGVVKDDKRPSHLNIQVWLPLKIDPANNSWTSASIYNYVELKEGFGIKDFERRLNELIKDQVYPALNPNIPYEEWSNSRSAYRFIIHPVTDLYLHSNLRFEFFTGGNAVNVYAFAAIALFIILLAGINFVNITTARSSGRAREVGIRKTLGSERHTLVLQFLNESVLTSLLALVLALALGEVFLKLFEEITSIHLLNTLFISFNQIVFFVAVAVLIGLTAGLYPAFYLSRFQPVTMLKETFGSHRISWFRNALVVTQFTISTCLIIATGVVYQQLEYMQNKDLGLNAENLMIIENVSALEGSSRAFRQEIQKIPGVQLSSFSKRIPIGNSVYVKTFNTPELENGIPLQTFYGDEAYLEAMEFQLLKGRNFSKERASDSNAVILNQKAVQTLELENAVGSRLNKNLEVIGVVDNFNFESLHSEAGPVAIMYSDTGTRLALKVSGEQAGFVLGQTRNIWDTFTPGEGMSYYFLDEKFRETLNNERALSKAVMLFAFFAIIISCLGLFGLTTYICEQRTKEIGIRKVLGASVSKILILLNKEFTRLILLSIVIAVPLSLIVIRKWLSNFAYKTEVGPLIFIFAGILAFVISWLTVSGQSLKTALTNPVKSLRSD